ncbi:MAG: S-layer homology domain-containing protein [Oscillospiraceae bacterium]
MKVLKRAFSAILILAVICTSITSFATGVVYVPAKTISFDENVGFKGIQSLSPDTAITKDEKGTDILHIVRDFTENIDTDLILTNTKIEDTSKFEKMKLTYRVKVGGWLQLYIFACDKDGNRITQFTVPKALEESSDVYRTLEFDASEMKTLPGVDHIEILVRGYEWNATNKDAASVIDISSIVFFQIEGSSVVIDGNGVDYNFSSNSTKDGWKLNESFKKPKIANGMLTSEIINNAPEMETIDSNLSINADEHSNVVIKFQNLTAAKNAKLYFKNDTMLEWSESACFNFEINPNSSKIDTYNISAMLNENWNGNIKAFKFIPTTENGTIIIDDIFIMKIPFNITSRDKKIIVSGVDLNAMNQTAEIKVVRPNAIKPEDVFFKESVTLNADGAYSFSFSIFENMNIDEYIITILIGDKRYDVPYVYTSETLENDLILQINDIVKAQNSSEMLKLLRNNCKYLTLNVAYFNKYTTLNTNGELFSEIFLKLGEIANFTDLSQNLDVSTVLTELNKASYDKVIETFDKYEKVINLKSVSTYATYLSMNNENKKIALQKIQAEKCYNYETLRNSFKSNIILTVIERNMGSDAINKILHENSEFIGINFTACEKLKFPDEVYLLLSGKTYKDVKALKDAFDVAVQKRYNIENATHDSGGSGGGGSGGGGNSGGSSAGGIYKKPEPTPTPSPTPTPTPTAKPEEFSDLDTVLWAKDSIYRLHKKGIVEGKMENLFAPLDNVTREEFVKMMIVAFSVPITDSDNTNKFEDVKSNEWYTPYVVTATNKGMINGSDDKRFGIGEDITREDICTIIYRLLGDKLNNMETIEVADNFVDRDEFSIYAIESIDSLSQHNIVLGMEDGSFKPKHYATRAEVAVIIDRLLERL